MIKIPKHLGLIYGILVVLIIALGTWWVIFLSREGKNYERYHQQRFTTEQIHALMLMRTVPEIAADPAGMLHEDFPDLIFLKTAEGPVVQVDPAARERVRHEARRRQRMFISEGIFFICLLAAGTAIIILAYFREREFRSARELFLAGASHEFRTPLASLQLYTETLTRPGLKDEDRNRIVTCMVEDLHRLEHMVDQVLAISREELLEHGEPELLDLARETGRVLADMEGFLIRKGARIESALAEGCHATGIRTAFAQALVNLVQNAAVHSPPPARITVTLERGESWHRLSVRDRGPGIPKRYRKKIFQSFFRLGKQVSPLASKTPGSGLGLYLVKRIMDMMGGKVELESEEGQGSTFTLLLPASRRNTS